MTDEARVVYHWWAEESDPYQHCQNLRSPIILSIASLRAQNPDIKIDVLDCTPNSHENIDGRFETFEEDDLVSEMWDQRSGTRWGEYPFRLGFNVRSIKWHLGEKYSDKPGYKHLSRLFDLNRNAMSLGGKPLSPFGPIEMVKQTIIYSDADVFWFSDPLPLDKDSEKVCFNGYNTGFFYFKNTSKTIWKFFDVFEAYTIGALNSKDIRQLMKKYVGYEAWYHVWDEMIMSYMWHENREFFNQIFPQEHLTTRNWRDPKIEFDIKMFHGNGSMMHNPYAKCGGEKEHCRGLIPMIWKELWEGINKVLGNAEIEEIYTQKEIEYYLPRQYSILCNEGRNRVLKTLNDDNHFYLFDSLQQLDLLI